MLVNHVLFVCSLNQWRSPTAEAIFRDIDGIEVDSAGLNNDAVAPLTPEHLLWADSIFLMEKDHLVRLKRKFPQYLKGKNIKVLHIPDRYQFMDAELIALLKTRCAHYLKPNNLPK